MDLLLAPSPRAVSAALVFLGYLAIAWSVGDLYPFSTHSMYAEAARGRPSRIVARDARGRIADVDAFDHWACPDLPALAEAVCPPSTPSSTIPYIDREAEDFLRAHAGSGQEGAAVDVDVVRHVWVFPPGDGAPASFDCVIRRCRAVRR